MEDGIVNFDMNRTWSQATALVGANFQLLAVIAGIFLLVPSVAIYLLMPDFFLGLQSQQDPEAIQRMLEDAAGPLIAFGFIAFLFQMVGYMAMIALMGDGRPTVGEALGLATRRLPSVIGATLLLVLVYMLLALVMGLAAGLIVAALTMVAGQGLAIALTVLVVIAMLVAIVYIMTRFTLVIPNIILDAVTNPVEALKLSWRATRSHALKIFAFYGMLLVVYFVASIIIGGIFGVAAAALGNGPASAMVLGISNGLIGAAVAMIFSGILVSMHQQLAGDTGREIEDTFG